MKASPLLRKWHARLSRQSLKTHVNYKWLGWKDNETLLFSCPTGTYEHTSTATILALGGMSWPRLGSDGNWLNLFKKNEIAVREFFRLIVDFIWIGLMFFVIVLQELQ